MRVFMFPGQGSQFKGMGRELFAESKMFKPLERQIDAIAGFSIREACLEGDERTLARTDVTQPCLFIVNALYHERQIARGKPPHLLAGHSLGEINALQAAGTFDLLCGLRIVVERGRLMAEQREGGMAAVIGLVPERIEGILLQSGLVDLDIANVNSASQVVLSGPRGSLERMAAPMLDAGAAAVIPLSVGAAFHSRYMRPAAQAFDEFLRDLPLRRPRLTVFSNVTAAPYPKDGDVEATTRELLVRQLQSRVRWDRLMENLQMLGGTEFIEVGPGAVLTHLLPN